MERITYHMDDFTIAHVRMAVCTLPANTQAQASPPHPQMDKAQDADCTVASAILQKPDRTSLPAFGSKGTKGLPFIPPLSRPGIPKAKSKIYKTVRPLFRPKRDRLTGKALQKKAEIFFLFREKLYLCTQKNGK